MLRAALGHGLGSSPEYRLGTLLDIRGRIGALTFIVAAHIYVARVIGEFHHIRPDLLGSDSIHERNMRSPERLCDILGQTERAGLQDIRQSVPDNRGDGSTKCSVHPW
jgi:hypothetical protein